MSQTTTPLASGGNGGKALRFGQNSVFHAAQLDFAKHRGSQDDGRLRWHFDIGFTGPLAKKAQVMISGWLFDVQANVPADAILVRSGSAVVARIESNLPNMRVVNALKVPAEARSGGRRCAFKQSINTPADHLSIEAEIGGETHFIGTAKPGKPQVLQGRAGWLFLDGDTNDSVAQHSEVFEPSSAWQEGWKTYFQALARFKEQGAHPEPLFLIAPTKEAVLPDYHPYARSRRTPASTLAGDATFKRHLIYPVSVMNPLREMVFDRVESHWTPFGARLVCEHLLRQWGLALPQIPEQWRSPSVGGDLGGKLIPPRTTRRLVANWPNNSRLIFDNLVKHHGRIRIFENAKAEINETLVIFGGSSTEMMEPYLTRAFQRVVNIHSVGGWDPDLLDHEQPNRILLQTNERFLVQPIDPIISVAQQIRRKVRGGHILGNGDYQGQLEQWSDTSVAWYKAL